MSKQVPSLIIIGALLGLLVFGGFTGLSIIGLSPVTISAAKFRVVNENTLQGIPYAVIGLECTDWWQIFYRPVYSFVTDASGFIDTTTDAGLAGGISTGHYAVTVNAQGIEPYTGSIFAQGFDETFTFNVTPGGSQTGFMVKLWLRTSENKEVQQGYVDYNGVTYVGSNRGEVTVFNVPEGSMALRVHGNFIVNMSGGFDFAASAPVSPFNTVFTVNCTSGGVTSGYTDSVQDYFELFLWLMQNPILAFGGLLVIILILRR